LFSHFKGRTHTEVFGNGMLRRKSAQKREELTGGWRRNA
jgi:hypothetical protein